MEATLSDNITIFTNCAPSQSHNSLYEHRHYTFNMMIFRQYHYLWINIGLLRNHRKKDHHFFSLQYQSDRCLHNHKGTANSILSMVPIGQNVNKCTSAAGAVEIVAEGGYSSENHWFMEIYNIYIIISMDLFHWQLLYPHISTLKLWKVKDFSTCQQPEKNL